MALSKIHNNGFEFAIKEDCTLFHNSLQLNLDGMQKAGYALQNFAIFLSKEKVKNLYLIYKIFLILRNKFTKFFKLDHYFFQLLKSLF